MATRNEHETARQLIFTQLQAAMVAAGGLEAARIEWPNLDFKQPDSGVWYRVTLGPGETNPAALGPNKLNRTPFVVIVQVFLPQKTNTQAAFALADIMGAELNYKTPSQTDGPTGTTAHVKFRTTSQPAFVGKDGGFEQYNITLPGYYDVTPGTAV